MSHISYIQYKTIKEMEDYKQTLYNDELLNILPDGVIIFDTNGEVIQLNQQAFQNCMFIRRSMICFPFLPIVYLNC